MTLERMSLLARAQVQEIQFGIESLSSSLLRLMGKGVKASANIATLRYAAAFGINVQWNMLFAFPGDKAAYYDEIFAILPSLRHLPPPAAAAPVLISRFSPYFSRPENYQISNIRPLQGYLDILPADAPQSQVAYHFLGDYPTASAEQPEIFPRLLREVVLWRRAWNAGPGQRPQLTVSRDLDGYFLMDTRGIPGCPKVATLSEQQTAQILTSVPLRDAGERLDWALKAHLGVAVDGMFVPLAVASPDVLAEFEYGQERARAGVESVV